jgi:hypothetical protein
VDLWAPIVRLAIAPLLRRTFQAPVIAAVTVTVVLLLLLGLARHNLYRHTWLWFGAFQAIALDCLRRTQQAEVTASPALEPCELAQGWYA